MPDMPCCTDAHIESGSTLGGDASTLPVNVTDEKLEQTHIHEFEAETGHYCLEDMLMTLLNSALVAVTMSGREVCKLT